MLRESDGVSLHHKPELDGIRGIAILGVLATHSCSYINSTPGTKPLLVVMFFGQWGVDLFFALSGFLITGILLDTRAAPNYFSSFYTRRVLRIWPIYYALLAILFSVALISPWVAANMPPRREWISYLFYVQNVPVFWANKLVVPVTMLGHFWSLAVEEQFYLIWPIAVLLLADDSLLEVCFIGFCVALPLRIFMLHIFGSSWGQMIITTARMDGLFLGAGYSILLHRLRTFSFKFFAIPGVVGLLILGWIAIFHGKDEFMGSGPYMRTFGVTAVALLACALIGLSQLHLRAIDRFLSMRFLRGLGRYSYGIYVFHIPIFIIVSKSLAPRLGIKLPLPLGSALLFILAINCASILIAVASFELFESKILRLKERFRPKFHCASANITKAAATP